VSSLSWSDEPSNHVLLAERENGEVSTMVFRESEEHNTSAAPRPPATPTGSQLRAALPPCHPSHALYLSVL